MKMGAAPALPGREATEPVTTATKGQPHRASAGSRREDSHRLPVTAMASGLRQAQALSPCQHAALSAVHNRAVIVS